MRLTRTMVVATGLALATAGCAATESKPGSEKRVVTCKDVVEVYKTNRSIDSTSSTLHVDQSVVDACVKAAGVAMPRDYNR